MTGRTLRVMIILVRDAGMSPLISIGTEQIHKVVLKLAQISPVEMSCPVVHVQLGVISVICVLTASVRIVIQVTISVTVH
jgi:hypothetical protein